MPRDKNKDVIFKDRRGGYVTRIQLDFFLNGRGAEKFLREFILSSPDSPISNAFTVYYDTCRVYNTLSDFMDQGEERVEMFWNEEEGLVEFDYDIGGVVDRKVKRMLR